MASGCRGAQNAGGQLQTCLHQALRPARLLLLKRPHIGRKLGDDLEIGSKEELPAAELRAIAQVGVFSERVMLPTPGVDDHRLAQHSGGPVEVEHAARAAARSLLESEMRVEQQALHLGQQRLLAVAVSPAALHGADAGIAEVADGAQQEVGIGPEVGVEHGDQLAAGLGQASRQGARLESLTAVPAQQPNRARPSAAARSTAASAMREVSSVESSSTWISSRSAG